MAVRLREEDEGRVGRRRWWGGGREVGDREGVIWKSRLKVVDKEECGGEDERDRGGRVAYSRRFVEELMGIACRQCVNSGDPIAVGGKLEIAPGTVTNIMGSIAESITGGITERRL